MLRVFCKQKTANEMRISDGSSDGCSSYLAAEADRALDAAVGDRLHEVGATDRRGQAGMDLALRGADVVVDVLAEVAHRQVAGLAVVPLEREVEVLRFQRLQAGVALRAGAALVAGKQVDGLAALDVVPLRTTDAVAVAAAQEIGRA